MYSLPTGHQDEPPPNRTRTRARHSQREHSTCISLPSVYTRHHKPKCHTVSTPMLLRNHKTQNIRHGNTTHTLDRTLWTPYDLPIHWIPYGPLWTPMGSL